MANRALFRNLLTGPRDRGKECRVMFAGAPFKGMEKNGKGSRNVPGTVELPRIRPVLNLQIRNTGEFGGVRRDDGETAGAADRSDFEIVRADHAAGGFELMALPSPARAMTAAETATNGDAAWRGEDTRGSTQWTPR